METTQAKRALRVAAELSAELGELSRLQSGTPAAPADHKGAEAGRLNDTYDLVIDDPELVSTTRELFHNRHWAQSVEEAFKYVNNLVKHRTGLTADGADLMNRALSLNSPILKLSPLKTESQRNQQLGYMQILSGAITGVRNPRAHEHRYLDDPRVALELLCLANHLSRVISRATRVRWRRAAATAARVGRPRR